jgi:hypothetical protein
LTKKRVKKITVDWFQLIHVTHIWLKVFTMLLIYLSIVYYYIKYIGWFNLLFVLPLPIIYLYIGRWFSWSLFYTFSCFFVIFSRWLVGLEVDCWCEYGEGVILQIAIVYLVSIWWWCYLQTFYINTHPSIHSLHKQIL